MRLHMCISAQAGPARPRRRGPARGPWADSERTCASTHVYLGTSRPGPAAPPRARKSTVGPAWAASGPEELRVSERELRLLRVESSTHAHLGTTGRETSWAREVWGARAASGRLRAGGAARLGADLYDTLYISAPPGRRRRPRRHRWHRTRKRTVGPAWSASEPEELLDSEREAAGSYVIERSSI
jgi:hypothetical protein